MTITHDHASGLISFVGAGPGASDLITVRGAERLRHADVVIWASSLVPEELLGHCRPGAEVHDSATMTLEDVLGVYGSRPDAAIVRLHSGDPSIYGAIAEQMDWCRERGRAFEIVPGVTSVSAAAAVLGRELTVPTVAQSVIATRLAGRTKASMPEGEGVAAMAAHGTSLAVFLAGARPDELQGELLGPGSAYGPDTPAAVLVRATWPDEQVVRTTVGELAGAIRSTGATMTVLVLVGDALGDGPVPARSHLYSPAYTTAYRLRSAPGSTEGRASRNR
jgi:precorrin-4/cobalt-precorrin-4 C11-methyltransferase